VGFGSLMTYSCTGYNITLTGLAMLPIEKSISSRLQGECAGGKHAKQLPVTLSSI